MAAPASYTEATLKQFIVDELAGTGVALGLTADSNQVAQAVNAVERLVGKAIADATDMALLEAAARVQAWVIAEAEAVGQFDIKAGAADLKQSQVFDHVQARLRQARSDWYAALAASQSSDGGSAIPFVFATVCGRRGR